ncbi:MAG: hypothetical protein ACK58T_48580, partial [Phycisphaerae bacterium]
PAEAGHTVQLRLPRSKPDAAADLPARLLDISRIDRRERIALRNAVDRRSWDFDWSHLGPAYHEAHDKAVERFFAGGGGGLSGLLGAAS